MTTDDQVLAELREFRGEVRSELRQLRRDDQRGEAVHEDHEHRLRRLERYMYVLTGIAAAAGSAVGSIAPRIIGG